MHDRFTAVDGRPVSELLRAGGISFGPREVGIAVELAWRTLAGEARQAVRVAGAAAGEVDLAFAVAVLATVPMILLG